MATSPTRSITQGDQVGNWNHAFELFARNNYALAPKNTFLYHVYFVITDVASPSVRQDPKMSELGMLVKQVSLPKFTIDTKPLNAYNRWHLVQNKIHYDAVNITFHDDAANVVRNFWYDYYKYYYRNSDDANSNTTGQASLSVYNAEGGSHAEIANERTAKDWGYSITKNALFAKPYLSRVHIYSLYNKKYSEYILHSPLIKNFAHGEHNASDGNGVMQHTMSIEYESVEYKAGDIREIDNTPVTGFGGGPSGAHYDTSKSVLLNQHLPPPETQDVYLDNSTQITRSQGVDLNSLNPAANPGLTALSANAVGQNIISSSNPFGSVQIPNPGAMLTGMNQAIAGYKGITASLSNAVGIRNAGPGAGLAQLIPDVMSSANQSLSQAGVSQSAITALSNTVSAPTLATSQLQTISGLTAKEGLISSATGALFGKSGSTGITATSSAPPTTNGVRTGAPIVDTTYVNQGSANNRQLSPAEEAAVRAQYSGQ